MKSFEQRAASFGEDFPQGLGLIVIANGMGTILLILSLFVESPLGFIITFMTGAVLVAVGVAIWSLIVVREAIQKGMFS